MHYLTSVKIALVSLIVVFISVGNASDENLYSCIYEGKATTYHENEAKRMILIGADCRIMGAVEHITCSMDGVRVDYSRREANNLLLSYPNAICEIGDSLYVSNSTHRSNTKPLKLQNRLTIYFAVNSNRLSKRDKAKIRAFAKVHRNMGNTYTITGYTSATGSSMKNQNLSLKRAGIVRNSLLDSGINADRVLSVDALGEESLRYRTKYEERRNRAVEIKAFGTAN